MKQKVHLSQMHIATNSEIIDISLEVNTAELAKKFSKILKKSDIVFFHGEIGVGKTTFIRHLVNCLQSDNHINQTEVTSPTFNLVKTVSTICINSTSYNNELEPTTSTSH